MAPLSPQKTPQSEGQFGETPGNITQAEYWSGIEQDTQDIIRGGGGQAEVESYLREKGVTAEEVLQHTMTFMEKAADMATGAYEGIKGMVVGEQDPEFEGVEGFTGQGFNPRTAYNIRRAKMVGVSDEAYGRLVKEALGARMIGEPEEDKHGNEIITYTDDYGEKRREYINSPGLDVRDVDRFLSQSIPYIVSGTGVGKLVKGVPIVGRGIAQFFGQGFTSMAQDVAASDEEGLSSLGDIDLTKAAYAAGGALFGEATMPVFRFLKEVVKKDPGLIDAQTGSLTARGVKAVEDAGLDPSEVTPEMLNELTAPDIVKGPDDPQAVMRAQSDQFDTTSSAGQRTKDPDLLRTEHDARSGTMGSGAKGVAQEFDATQRSQVAAAVDTQTQRLAGGADEAVEGFEEAGTNLQQGLSSEKARDAARITKAYKDVDVDAIFPGGIPQKSFDDLGVRIREGLGTQNITTDLKETTKALDMLADFMEGKVREPTSKLLKAGGPPRKMNFYDIRKNINEHVGDALAVKRATGKGADYRAVAKVKTAYNEWIQSLADGALENANPEQFALLQKAIGITAKAKKRFEVSGKNDAAGKMIKKIMEAADSPEGAINKIFSSAFKTSPKDGARTALIRMKGILEKEQPEAWHAMRQAYWLKLARQNHIFRNAQKITRVDMDTALGQISTNIENAFNHQSSMLKILYSKEELNRMRSFGLMARRNQSVNLNPSGTATELMMLQRRMRDNVLTNLLRRQAMSAQLARKSVEAVWWRVMKNKAVSILGAHGEGIAARQMGKAFSGRLPKRRGPGGGGLGGAIGSEYGSE